MASPDGPGAAQRRAAAALAARALYPDVRQDAPEKLPRSPVIGTDSPVQYEQRDDIGPAAQAYARRSA